MGHFRQYDARHNGGDVKLFPNRHPTFPQHNVSGALPPNWRGLRALALGGRRRVTQAFPWLAPPIQRGDLDS
jgi:hypothetical protein